MPVPAVSAAEGGREQLVLCEPGLAAESLLATLREAGVAEPELVRAATGADAEAPEAALRARLADARVGVRLHLAGSDAFVRRMSAVAHEAGLQADEISVAAGASGEPAAYRVACVHCRAITEPVAATVVPCAGCGRSLFVYHHFSRRKAAYMGFQADAEVAGELPESRSGLPCP